MLPFGKFDVSTVFVDFDQMSGEMCVSRSPSCELIAAADEDRVLFRLPVYY
jgi:hypothetical protein